MSLITPAVYREHDPGTSLEDDAIQRLIDSNETYMVRVLGPHSIVGRPVVQVLRGRSHSLLLEQGAGSVVQVRERGEDASWTVLDALDYMTLDGGQTLVRLGTGPNSARSWAVLVEVTYVPLANLAERMVGLLEMVGTDAGAGITTSGAVVSRTMGSWSETYGSGGATSREAVKAGILERLRPRAGIVFA
jgi:hypothetical protein